MLVSQVFEYFLKDGTKVDVLVITSKQPGIIFSKLESSVEYGSVVVKIFKNLHESGNLYIQTCCGKFFYAFIKLCCYLQFLPTWRWSVGPKHIVQLILNKWIIVFDLVYCNSCYLTQKRDELFKKKFLIHFLSLRSSDPPVVSLFFISIIYTLPTQPLGY